MGLESFRVELRGGQATYPEVEEAIRALPHVRPDPQAVLTPGSACYVVDDGRHVIEVELLGPPVRLSCRFTLCHPPSIDPAFLGFVRELMARLGMEARVCDDVPPEQAHPFSVACYEEFAALALRCIAARRAEWREAFGADQAAATTREAHERFILPHCQPVHEQA
jgi:hypothetical protein